MTIVFYLVCALTGLVLLLYYGRSAHPVRSALWGMLTGAGGLFLAGWAGGFIGAVLPVNLFTTFVALTLGIPGVTMMLISLILM